MKTPSTWLKAVGPCCCPLMKKVRVCLFRSSSTPTVAPLHTPPSVLGREAGVEVRTGGSAEGCWGPDPLAWKHSGAGSRSSPRTRRRAKDYNRDPRGECCDTASHGGLDSHPLGGASLWVGVTLTCLLPGGGRAESVRLSPPLADVEVRLDTGGSALIRKPLLSFPDGERAGQLES